MQLAVIVLLPALYAVASAASGACSRLNGASLPAFPHPVRFNATAVDAGELHAGQAINNNIAFCRVTGSISYGPGLDNTLLFELWLPNNADYNGRYLAVGNGGFAGTISTQDMIDPLNNGYAVASGDSGHPTSENGVSQSGSYAAFFHDKSKVLTWMRDSIAMFTEPATALSAIYYGYRPRKMYYSGCSTGGGQGFALAQHYPSLFDGIIASCPANWYTHIMISFLWNALSSAKPGAFLPQDALDLITKSVLDQCDALDGQVDRVLADPSRCNFDIATLQCTPCQAPIVNNKTMCLTKPQVENVRKFYKGPANTVTGQPLYPGLPFGSETAWMGQQNSLYLNYSVPLFQNLVFNDLDYNYKSFDWAADVDVVDRLAGPFIDDISPDLEEFRKAGGKMIVTQAWADELLAAQWPIQHRERLRTVSGDALETFFSLFMIPGAAHCSPSKSYPHVPAKYDTLDRLVAWVERGELPRSLIGTEPLDGSDATVTLHPYPRY